MSVVSLFSGIGGLELGLEKHGFRTKFFCENDPAASLVLQNTFPDIPLKGDVQTLRSIPACEILSAGFPCQDLSLAGGKAGLSGARSGLVGEVFRLISTMRRKPRWLLFENVPYMLVLDKGSGMRRLVDALEAEGYNWAYRVVDARSFGLPQRRQRILLLASRKEDPRNVLFADESNRQFVEDRPSRVTLGPAYGFYWTMGKMGAGWAREATPPIKGGSSIGIPSPPAIWLSARDFVGTPMIEDAERLQGFASGWTRFVTADTSIRQSARWRLVGNAVCPPMAEWVGSRLFKPGVHDPERDLTEKFTKWPKAAWGVKGVRRAVNISEWPLKITTPQLEDFLHFPLKPLSARATRGFRGRALESKEIAWAPEFIESLRLHILTAEKLERSAA